MQQDIRNMLKNHRDKNVELTNNHSAKFESLLQQEIHNKKSKKINFRWLSIAASIVLLISLGIKFYPTNNIEDDPKNTVIKKVSNAKKDITLGNISPEFQTLETYYTNSINLALSELDVNDENKDIIDGYLLKIAQLTKEYKSLTKELNTNGVNDATIDALISNLQLRLQLLQRLKKQLKQIKQLNTTKNETQII